MPTDLLSNSRRNGDKRVTMDVLAGPCVGYQRLERRASKASRGGVSQGTVLATESAASNVWCDEN